VENNVAVSEAHKKASYKYNASRDSITIRPERSKGAAIRAAAVASGKSLQNYILDALDARMEQEGRPLTLEEGAENEN
jgi:predicted DNA binding CopG/RHH family protein